VTVNLHGQEWVLMAGGLLALLLLWILRSRARKRLQQARERLADLEAHLSRQTRELLDERNARQILEDRIVGEVATFTTLYESARALTHLDPERIRQGAMQLLGTVIKVQEGALYERDNATFRRTARFPGDAVPGTPLEVVTIQEPLVALLSTRGRLVSVKDLMIQEKDLDKTPFLALAPIRGEGNTVIGFLSIEKIDFLRFSSVTLQLLDRLADWISQSYAQARMARSLQDRQLIDPELGIFSSATLAALLREARTGTAASLHFSDIAGLPSETVAKLLASLTTLIEPGIGLLAFKGLDAGELALWGPTLEVSDLEQRLQQINTRFQSLGLKIPGHTQPIGLQWRVFSVDPAKRPAS